MSAKFILTLILVVAIFPGWVPKNIFPGPTFLSFLSLTFLILNALQWRKCDSRVAWLSPISICLLLFYGWGALGYFFTGSLDISYSPIINYIGGVFLYFGLIIYIKDEAKLHEILWIGLICAAIHSLSVVYQVLPTGWFLGADSGISHFRNKNIFSSFILFFLPVAIFLSSCSIFKGLKYLARVFFVLLLVVFLFAGSRAGEAAAITQLLLMGAYMICQKDYEGVKNLVVLTLISTIIYSATIFVLNKVSLHILIFQIVVLCVILLYESGKKRVKGRVLLILVSIIIFGATFFTLQKVSSKLQSFSSGIEIKNNAITSINTRIHYWQGTLGIIKDDWLTGSGPNTFSLVIPIYLADINDQRSFDLDSASLQNPPSAHNLFLQIASESGVIALCFFFAVVYFVCSKSYSLFRNAPGRVHELAFYAVVSITGFLFHNLVEFNWYPSEFIYTFTILIFIVDFTTQKYIPTSQGAESICSRSFLVTVWGIILIGGVISFNYYFYLKTIKPDNVFIDESSPMWERSVDRAKVMCPRCSEPFLIKGKEQLNKYYSTLNPVHLVGSKHQFDTVVQNNPLDLRPLPYLVQALTLQEQFQKAKDVCYKLLKYQRYEFIGRMQLAIIMLVEANVAENALSGPKQIVEAWNQAAKKVAHRRKKVADSLGKAIVRNNQFMRQKD